MSNALELEAKEMAKPFTQGDYGGGADALEQTAQASWRHCTGVSGGFPTAFDGAQRLTPSYFQYIGSKPWTDSKVAFTSASLYTETGGGNTVQTECLLEYPIGTEPQPYLFSGSVTGVIPNTGFKDLESDSLHHNVPVPPGGVFKMWTWHNGAAIPSCGGSLYESLQGNDYEFTYDAGAQGTHCRPSVITRAQMKALTAFPGVKIAQNGGAWSAGSGGVQTLNVQNHTRTDTLNTKLLVSGFTTANGVDINGLYNSWNLSGTNALTIPVVADTGGIIDPGLVSYVTVVTSMVWSATNGGQVTVTIPGTAQPSGSLIEYVGMTPSGYNGKHRVTKTGANTYTFPLATDPGSAATTTNGYSFSRNIASANAANVKYFQRPQAILAFDNDESYAGLGDSRSTPGQVDYPSDESGIAGIIQRCIGKSLRCLNLSASIDRLQYHVTGANGDHAIRREFARRYTTSFFLGLGTNDIPNYAVSQFPTLKGYWDSFKELEPWATMVAKGRNIFATVPNPNTNSRDQYATFEGQSVNAVVEAVKRLWNDLLSSELGTTFSRKFDVERVYENPKQRGVWKTSKRQRDVIVTTVASDSLVAFDASTPISPLDHGENLAIPGAGSGPATGYGVIYYISPTSAFLYSNDKFNTPSSMANLVAGVTAKLGARKYVIFANSGATVHEKGGYAFEQVEKEIGLPQRYNWIK